MGCIFSESGRKSAFILIYFRACSALLSQSIASSSPSPLVAEVLNIWNVLSLRASRPSSRCTSAKLIQPCISCLLANTTKIAPASSSSCKTTQHKRSHYNKRGCTFAEAHTNSRRLYLLSAYIRVRLWKCLFDPDQPSPPHR